MRISQVVAVLALAGMVAAAPPNLLPGAASSDLSSLLAHPGVALSHDGNYLFNDVRMPPLNDAQGRQFGAFAAHTDTHPEAHDILMDVFKAHARETKARMREVDAIEAQRKASKPFFWARSKGKELARENEARELRHRHVGAELGAVEHESASVFLRKGMAEAEGSRAHPAAGEVKEVMRRFRGHPLPWMTDGEAATVDRIADPRLGANYRYVHRVIGRFAERRKHDFEPLAYSREQKIKELNTAERNVGHLTPSQRHELGRARASYDDAWTLVKSHRSLSKLHSGLALDGG